MIRRALAFAFGTAGALYLAVCGLLYLSQDSYLYYPVARHGPGPVFVLRRGDADVAVSTNGAESRRAVVYFGGNAEDVSRAMPLLARAFPGRAVYAMHYRGYGGSTGRPSERALVGDAKALLATVAMGHPDVVVVGRSLGSGIAIQAAVGRRVGRLVLVTPYDSIVELAASRFRLFPVRWLLRDRYESWRFAPKIDVPTTIIVAGRDQVVPNGSTQRLVRRFAPGVAHVVGFPDADHDNVSGAPGYLEILSGARLQGD